MAASRRSSGSPRPPPPWVPTRRVSPGPISSTSTFPISRSLDDHGTSKERDIGKVDVLEMGPGETLRVGTQGGGGLGDPLDRLLAAIVEDVRNGLVTPEGAFDGYGVV